MARVKLGSRRKFGAGPDPRFFGQIHTECPVSPANPVNSVNAVNPVNPRS